ncbi:DUF7448 domain-containing protein [Pediococcus acidilactici]|uniref:DUF7448 domain-containing protein n=1 Tax=Pediococcus acidilactici TaxID=1254 RepID=A0AAW8YJM5_PEDAC|nr:hypothetical protein [Pediococcus acidilactici]MDV2621956.1 hypothetical protein [Pediococcus acidilactici]
MRYGDFGDLKKQLISHRVVEWTPDKLVLENGTVLSIEESESDCCAWAGGEFENVKLDAVITDVGDPEIKQGDDEYNEGEMLGKVTLFHNLNPVAVANCSADRGGSGYYYSVCSLAIKDVYYKVVES